ncbi:hypothetical protein OF83DRAFT_111709 [Amylostereum chailletii]|nr:hypothetical protein OF83DRAFT_111709 [Amylostereum chailletii]
MPSWPSIPSAPCARPLRLSLVLSQIIGRARRDAQTSFQERIRDLERQLGVAQMGGPSTQPAGGFQPREGPIASTPDPTLDVSSHQMPPRAVDTYHGALVYDRLPSPRFSQPQRERPLEPTMAEPSPQEPTVSNLEPNEMFPPRRNPVYAVVPQTNHEHTSGSERMSTGSLAQPSNHPSSSGSGRMSARSSGESLAAMLEETGIEDGEVIMPGNALGLGSMSGRASPVRSLRSRAGSFGASSSVGHAPGRSRSGSFGTSSDVDEPPFIPDSPESDYGHPPWSRINSQGGRRSDRRSSMNASSSSDVVASSRDRAFTYPSSAPFRSPAARPQHAASSPYAPPNIYSSTRIGVMPLRGTPPDPPASGSSRSSRRRGSGSSHAGTSLRNNTVPLPDDTFETHAAPGDGWGHDAWSGASPVFPDDGRESVPAFSNPNRGPAATPYPTTALGLSLESPPFSPPVSPAEFHPPPPPGRPFQAPQMGIVSPLNSEQSWSVPSPPLLENINPFRLAPIQSPPNGQPRAVEPSFGLREMNSRSSRLPPPPPPPAHHVSPASRFQRPGSYFSPAASEYTNLPLSSTLSTRAPLPAQEAVVAPRERYPNTVAPGMRSSVSERPSTSATAGPSYPYEGSAPAFASFTQAGYWMHQGQNQNH